MAKKTRFFPTTCLGCEHRYHHNSSTKLYSGGIMKSAGNDYCTAGKRHKKLKPGNSTKLRPADCPVQEQYPIEVPEEETT